VRQRTTVLNDWTSVGSALASTEVKVILTAVAALTMWLVWRRWTEPMMLVLPLVLEASVFITVTWLVRRPRPDVPRLEGSPVDSSFPSGHVAAAAVYGALAVVVAWHTRKIWIRVVVGAVTALVVLAVALSRMYRGMHAFTDVVAGAVLGFVAVVLAWWMVRELMRRGVSEQRAGVVPAAGELEGTRA
jgi:undecaprenyl-diphosphatase